MHLDRQETSWGKKSLAEPAPGYYPTLHGAMSLCDEATVPGSSDLSTTYKGHNHSYGSGDY